MKTTRIKLTTEEKAALRGYPNTIALQYIWIAIMSLREMNIPTSISDIKVQYLCDDEYLVEEVDYSLAP